MKEIYAVLLTALASCCAAGSQAQGYITARPRFAHAIGVSANICYTSLAYTQDVSDVSESRMTILPGIRYKATFPVSRASGFSFYPHVGILLPASIPGPALRLLNLPGMPGCRSIGNIRRNRKQLLGSRYRGGICLLQQPL